MKTIKHDFSGEGSRFTSIEDIVNFISPINDASCVNDLYRWLHDLNFRRIGFYLDFEEADEYNFKELISGHWYIEIGDNRTGERLLIDVTEDIEEIKLRENKD